MKPPKDYAEELVDKYYSVKWHNGKKVCSMSKQAAKDCAIIAVDEMIESYEFDVISDMTNQRYIDKLNYLDEVRQEINKL
jgi:acetolactate synthase regulatory subunit